MFGLFKKKTVGKGFSYDQAVLLTIPLSGGDLGSKAERTAIQKLEDDIGLVLPSNSGIDGHEFGERNCTVYIYGPLADDLWRNIEPVIRSSGLDGVRVTLEYGRPDDPRTKDKSFEV